MPEMVGRSTQRPYDLVVFDFDGTLADTFGWFLENLDLAAERYGFEKLDPTRREEIRGWTVTQIAYHLGVPMWKMPRVAQFMRNRMGEEIGRISTFPGIDELLPAVVSTGAILGLVSSNSFENIRSVLGANADLFLHRSCGVSLFGKASKLRKILAASGVSADRAILVGDEIRDQEAARAVGMRFGAVSWGYNRAEALRERRPDEWFASLHELSKRLL